MLLALVVVVFTAVAITLVACPRKKTGDAGRGGIASNAGGGQVEVIDNAIPPGAETGKMEIRVYVAGDRVGSDCEIFVFRPDDLEHAIAKPKDGETQLLEVGTYDVQVVYTDDSGMEHTKWFEGLEVAKDAILSEKLAFDFGSLTVEVGGAGTAYTAADIEVSVFPEGRSRKPVAEGAADAPIDLLDGKYDVLMELRKGSSRDEVWERGVVIAEGETTSIEVNFSGGSLVVRLQGGKSLPGAHVYVYDAGDTSNPVADGEPGEEMNIGPGTYDILVTLGGGGTRYEYWEKGVEVRRGKTNRVDIKLPVGSVKVNAFSSGGGQIAGTEFTVFVYESGNTSNSILAVNGAETFTLDEGVYDLRVEYTNSQNRPSVWINKVSIANGQHQTLRADFEVTSITTTVFIRDEELSGDKVQVYYYPVGDENKVAGSTISGQPAILEAGEYKIKVQWTGGPVVIEEWVATRRAESGKSLMVEHRLKAGWAVFKTKSGEVIGLSVRNVQVSVNLGDKILLPQGVYYLRTPEGETVTLDIGAGGTHEY
jgi:hypothetical protein